MAAGGGKFVNTQRARPEKSGKSARARERRTRATGAAGGLGGAPGVCAEGSARPAPAAARGATNGSSLQAAPPHLRVPTRAPHTASACVRVRSSSRRSSSSSSSSSLCRRASAAAAVAAAVLPEQRGVEPLPRRSPGSGARRRRAEESPLARRRCEPRRLQRCWTPAPHIRHIAAEDAELRGQKRARERAREREQLRDGRSQARLPGHLGAARPPANPRIPPRQLGGVVDVRRHIRARVLGPHQSRVVALQQGPPPVAGEPRAPAAALRPEPPGAPSRQAQGGRSAEQHRAQRRLHRRQRHEAAGQHNRRTAQLSLPVARDTPALRAARQGRQRTHRGRLQLPRRDPDIRLQLAPVQQFLGRPPPSPGHRRHLPSAPDRRSLQPRGEALHRAPGQNHLRRPVDGDQAFRGAGPPAGHDALHDLRRLDDDARLPRDDHVDHPQQADIHHEAAAAQSEGIEAGRQAVPQGAPRKQLPAAPAASPSPGQDEHRF